MAPEILDQKPYRFKIDVWSATIIVFILLCGNMPYKGATQREVLDCIEQADMTKLLTLPAWSHVSKEGKEFIKMGLQINPRKRATLKKMLDHDWLKEVKLPSEVMVPTKNSQQSLFIARAGQRVTFKQMKKINDGLEHIMEQNKFSVQNSEIYKLIESDFDQGQLCQFLQGLSTNDFERI